MKTILVALDGSAAAEKALDVALDLAQKHGATLNLLHVLLRDREPSELLHLPELARTGGGLASELGRLVAAPVAERSAAEIMAQPGRPSRPVPEALLRKIGDHVLTRGCAKAAGRQIRAEALALADGPAAPAVVAAAAKLKADAIVMGSRGLRQIEAFTFGSVSQDVCRTAACTCIAVH